MQEACNCRRTIKRDNKMTQAKMNYPRVEKDGWGKVLVVIFMVICRLIHWSLGRGGMIAELPRHTCNHFDYGLMENT